MVDMTLKIINLYSTADVCEYTNKFTGYELHVSQTGEVVKAIVSPYSKENGGFYDVQEKQRGQEGFEELVQRVFRALEEYDWIQIRNLKNDYPNLYATLKSNS